MYKGLLSLTGNKWDMGVVNCWIVFTLYEALYEIKVTTNNYLVIYGNYDRERT